MLGIDLCYNKLSHIFVQHHHHPVHDTVLGCIFWRNYGGIIYITVLSCRTQRNYVSLCHQKTEKEQKLTPKECVSTSATADLHTYFLRATVVEDLDPGL